MNAWTLSVANILNMPPPVDKDLQLSATQTAIIGLLKERGLRSVQIAEALGITARKVSTATVLLKERKIIRNLRAGTGFPAVWVLVK